MVEVVQVTQVEIALGITVNIRSWALLLLLLLVVVVVLLLLLLLLPLLFAVISPCRPLLRALHLHKVHRCHELL